MLISDNRKIAQNYLRSWFLLDVTTVYDKEGHELFGQWVVLLNPDEGSTVQGFLRVSVAVLRTSSGDEYVLHKPEDLDEQEARKGAAVYSRQDPKERRRHELHVARLERARRAEWELSLIHI